MMVLGRLTLNLLLEKLKISIKKVARKLSFAGNLPAKEKKLNYLIN